MDKIVEALKKILPEEHTQEVAEAVQAMVEEAKQAIDAEAEANLTEAYKKMVAEKDAAVQEAEEVANEGYQQAYAMLEEALGRLDQQNEAWDQHCKEQFEEAFKEIETERKKNENIEVELYEEFDKKLKDMYGFMVERLHEFLQEKGVAIYEQARRDLLNDPRVAEHKLALDKIAQITAGVYDGDYATATANKIEESKQHVAELEGRIKIMESRNMRLSLDNQKLNETVRKAESLINESRNAVVEQERKERAEKAKNVQGRGHRVVDEQLIAEFNQNQNPGAESEDDGQQLVEGTGGSTKDYMRKLAGLVNDDEDF